MTLSLFELKPDNRLGIRLPVLYQEWEAYSPEQQSDILLAWEEGRSAIPDRIIQLESIINRKQRQLFEEENFEQSCLLVHEIHDLASIINDLHIWFRSHQEVESKRDL